MLLMMLTIGKIAGVCQTTATIVKPPLTCAWCSLNEVGRITGDTRQMVANASSSVVKTPSRHIYGKRSTLSALVRSILLRSTAY